MKLLMLPSAHSAVLVVGKPERFERLVPALFVFGVLMTLMGGLDLLSRIPASADTGALETAFAPAVTLIR
jgi:hypothetical protein